MVKKIAGLLLILSAFAALGSTVTGCNTVAGAGTDIERGGEALRDTARDAQRKM